jgi:drug/metabolite transporter (DMT)-like permease
MNKKLLGELSIMASALFFAITAILIKTTSGVFSGLFISLVRFSVGIILVIVSIYLTKRSFKVKDKKAWLLRGFFGAIAMVLYYVSIQLTSSGRATLLTYTYPVFVAIYGYLFFKEKLTTKTIISVILGVTGILFVFYDGSHYPLYGNLLGLMSAVFAGIAIHYIKILRELHNSIMVYLPACIFGILFTLPSIREGINLTFNSFALLALIAITVFIAQMFMSYGYKHVSPTRGSIIALTAVPLVILFSYFIGEEMKIRFFIGTAFIIAGLIINR